MLDRKITNKLEQWYKAESTALLVDGARQVGKTTSIREFLKQNQLDYIELNLLQNKIALEAFNTSVDEKQLLFRISSLANKSLVDHKTIIFIDEIQEADDAITPIKYLVQNSNFRFIFSGFLLGIKMKDVLSIPVGFLSIIQMYPMDFEEFAKAIGVSEKIFSYLKDCFANKSKVDEIVHKQMINLFNTYLVVGGMPKAVEEFVQTNDISKVNLALKDIDYGYKQDIAKYEGKDKLLIQEIYDLIPNELNSKTKRFILKNMNEKARFYQYEASFAWLKNSGVGLFVHNVDNPVFPLLASKKRTLFKLFLSDVGLLTYKLCEGRQIEFLNGDANINYGAIYEDVVAQELTAHGFSLFYNSDKKRGEVDFLIELNGKVIPLEIKSGKDYKRHSSLSQLLENHYFGIDEAYVFCNGNVEIKGKVNYLPIYMVSFIKKKEQEKSQIVKLDISSLI